jgi:hypothetical protein
MQKKELLNEIEAQSRNNAVNREEVVDAYEKGRQSSRAFGASERLRASEIFYYIGGAIVFLGIAILIRNHWLELTLLAKLLVTLGISLVSYIAGIYINQNTSFKKPADAFFLISALLLPIGLYVAFHENSSTGLTDSLGSLISCVSLAAFLASYNVFKRDIFILFSIIFGTWFFYAFTSYILAGTTYVYLPHLEEYKTLLVGLAYLYIAFLFSGLNVRTWFFELEKERHRSFISLLFSIGSLFVLLSTLFLTGWRPNQSVVWEILYPLVLLVFFFASVRFRVRSFLTFGSIFLFFYILKLTYEYFQNSFGWPVALVISGLALVGIGFLSFYLGNRYMGKEVK